jgi:hypothetical protein
VSVPTSRGKRGEPLSPPSSPSPLPRKIWGVSDAFKTAPAVLGWSGRRRRPPPEVGVPLGWVGFRHLGKKERKKGVFSYREQNNNKREASLSIRANRRRLPGGSGINGDFLASGAAPFGGCLHFNLGVLVRFLPSWLVATIPYPWRTETPLLREASLHTDWNPRFLSVWSSAHLPSFCAVTRFWGDWGIILDQVRPGL